MLSMSKQDSCLLSLRHRFIVYLKTMSTQLVMPRIELSNCKLICLLANLWIYGVHNSLLLAGIAAQLVCRNNTLDSPTLQITELTKRCIWRPAWNSRKVEKSCIKTGCTIYEIPDLTTMVGSHVGVLPSACSEIAIPRPHRSS